MWNSRRFLEETPFLHIILQNDTESKSSLLNLFLGMGTKRSKTRDLKGILPDLSHTSERRYVDYYDWKIFSRHYAN